MKVLGVGDEESGCSFHRIVLPLGYMSNVKGLCTNMPTDEVFNEKWDILIYNRVSQLDGDIKNVKEKIGCKVVFDIDDDWILPSNNLYHESYKKLKPIIESNIAFADLVTTTNEELAKKIIPLNPNVAILPNGIPYGEYKYTPERLEDEKIRIFWCGGISHEIDIHMLKNPIRRLEPLKNKIQMVIGGYDNGNWLSKFIWNKMVNYFTSAQKLDFKVIANTTPKYYMEMFNHADIMLIPLVANDWSACKSNLKLLEASSKKLPCIVSKCKPYTLDHDAPVFWVEKQSDWYKHINFLVNNKQARIDYGEKIYEYAKAKYNIYDINRTRRATFENLIKA